MSVICRNGKLYSYRSTRSGGRVVVAYAGAGPEMARRLAGELACAQAERDLRRFERQDEADRRAEAAEVARRRRRAFRKLRASVAATDPEVRGLVEEVRAATSEIMERAGFRRRTRSWRGNPMANATRKMKAATPATATASPTILPPAPAPPAPPATPRESSIVARTVNLLLEKHSEGDPIRRAVAYTEFRNVLASLLAEGDGPIERLIAERAAVCWLDSYIADRVALNVHTSMAFTPGQKLYFVRARDAAHRRFLATLLSLNTVRSRALPVLAATRLTLAVDGRAVAVVEAAGT